MTQDVTQWLAEIKALKQQLAESQQERDQAYASAANWQRLYETEAQQRRAEAGLARQRIEELMLEIQHLQGKGAIAINETAIRSTIQAEVEQWQTTTELRQQLVAALIEREQLVEALKVEQSNHAQTRKSLTTALGDAIDQLSKGNQSESQKPN